MNKNKFTISTCTLLGCVMQSYAQTPEEMAILLQKQCGPQVNAIYADPQVNELSIAHKFKFLERYTWRHIAMADLVLATNLEEIIPMPYAQWNCPQVPVELLRTEGSIQIGKLDQQKIYDLICVPIELADLSNGVMCNVETSEWVIYALSQDSVKFGQYLQYRENMGPLAEMYLEAKEHPDNIVLPDMPPNTPTLAYPTDIVIRNADGQPNPEFFITWWNRIQARFACDTAVVQTLGDIIKALPTQEATNNILSNLGKGQLSSDQCGIIMHLLQQLSIVQACESFFLRAIFFSSRE
jgi:hypothetical protein